MTARVLLTGATGFVGRPVCEALERAGYRVRVALRSDQPPPAGATEKVQVGPIGAATVWADALRDVNLVVHLAARAHVLGDAPTNADLYIETNAHGTRRLAEAAAQAGVRRFVYLSSIKVNGEETSGRAYTSADEPQPRDAYAESKWLAESSLREIGAATSMEVVSVRAPLVYGPGVRANFLRLLSWVDRGWPLPFGGISNRRSMVSIWNLCDLLLRVVTHPAAARRTWMVCDGHDLSTPELIARMGDALHRRVRLWSVPVALLRAGAALAQREQEFARLCGSLTVDMAETVTDLQWSPPMGVDEALARTVRWYRERDARRVL